MNGKTGRLALPAVMMLAVMMLAACATGPTGPSVAVMPGQGVPFEKFQADDVACRQWADQQIGGASAADTANRKAVGGAVLGTLIGAGLGAAIGGATGNAGAGAAIGGATGLVGGTAVGSSAGAASAQEIQRRYDIAYMQCMYSRGHQTPAGYSPQPVAQQTSGAPESANQPEVLEADTADSTPVDVTRINFNDAQGAKPGTEAGTAEARRNIMEAQRLLKEKGYYAGTPDGRMGPRPRRPSGSSRLTKI